MKTSFKSKVFKIAWEILHSTGKSFAVCLSKSWAIYRLRKSMSKGIASFAFEKVDGSLRRAKGTLNNIATYIKGTGQDSFKTVAYFDVEAHGFRSFKVENLVTIY